MAKIEIPEGISPEIARAEAQRLRKELRRLADESRQVSILLRAYETLLHFAERSDSDEPSATAPPIPLIHTTKLSQLVVIALRELGGRASGRQIKSWLDERGALAKYRRPAAILSLTLTRNKHIRKLGWSDWELIEEEAEA
jgi:broad specificity phosphatase PhoE